MTSLKNVCVGGYLLSNPLSDSIAKTEMGLIKMKRFTSVGQEKVLSPRRESNPLPPRCRVGALTTELRETLN